ncbi:MAG: DUF4125 family protein [Treponema sp.]|nr:DUF4125 family protein [Treponema sp.]
MDTLFTADQALIDKVIDKEWIMFQRVNEESGSRASCQEDRHTFNGMRRAQFEAWSQEALESYFNDLTLAALAGRNLLKEKYIHMMKATAPADYELLLPQVAMPTAETAALASRLSNKIVEQAKEVHGKYAQVAKFGRPIDASQDNNGETSIETYQMGEMLTYSKKTLVALSLHIEALEKVGVLFAQALLENTVKFYNYNSLAEADAAAGTML